MRKIGFPPGFEEDVTASFEALSDAGLVGVDFLWEELERFLPERADLCGHVAVHLAVYAQAIPGARGHFLVTSFDTRRRQPWPCTIHGQIRSRTPCVTALDLVDRQKPTRKQ